MYQNCSERWSRRGHERLPSGAPPRKIVQASDLPDNSGHMAKATWRRRGTFWLGMATVAVTMTAVDPVVAQEARVASNALDDAQDSGAGLLTAPGAPSVAPDAAVIVPSTQRTPSA